MNGIDSTRRYGVLLHPTAISSKWGVGDIGISSRNFLSWLKAAGAKVWQLLPIGVVDKWGCPYSSLSAFGGNPMLICLEDLVELNLLSPTQLTTSPSEYDKVHFKKAWAKKKSLLLQSFTNFKADGKNEDSFNLFLQKEGHWVHDLANFLVLTQAYGDDWTDWPSGLKSREVEAIEKFEEAHENEISFEIYLQYLFDLQWKKLKEAANDDGIELFGDIPIFVAHHSMDVWRHPERFKLNDEGKMSLETGAPPDAFSETGQKWGTPNYNWEIMKSLGFECGWIE